MQENSHTVDGRNPAPPAMCKTLNTGIKLPINWCRISSNSSMCQISTLLEVFFRLVSGSNSQPHSEATFFLMNGRSGEYLCVYRFQILFYFHPRPGKNDPI